MEKAFASSFPGKPRFIDKPIVHIALIALIGLIAYSNTFQSPFQWDDKHYIAENPIVKNLDYFLEPSKAEGFDYFGSFRRRYVGYLTFALNYRVHGLDPAGYHALNIAIHILNALLVYFLVRLTFRTPFLGGPDKEGISRLIALLSGLLFVSHPVQTEAVTYIFQRFASLAVFFYLCSLVLYIKWRLGTARRPTRYRNVVFYLLSIASAILAMKTKENAFTLPLAITLYEFLFFSGPARGRLLRLMPLLLTLLIVPSTIMGADTPAGEIIGGIGPATRGYEQITRGSYLLTQLRVIVTYIRLLLYPANQNLYYDYPVFHSLFNLQVSVSFLFLLSVFGLGIYLFYLSRLKAPILRLTSFGIFLVFLALSV
jgi:hypothetical protein